MKELLEKSICQFLQRPNGSHSWKIEAELSKRGCFCLQNTTTPHCNAARLRGPQSGCAWRQMEEAHADTNTFQWPHKYIFFFKLCNSSESCYPKGLTSANSPHMCSFFLILSLGLKMLSLKEAICEPMENKRRGIFLFFGWWHLSSFLHRT